MSLQVGVALKPATPVETVLPHISSVDMVLVMTAEPGVKGQEEVNNTLHKVETLRQKCPNLLIKTDGWDQPSREQASLTSKSDRSSTAVEQRSQEMATNTSSSCTPEICSITKAHGQHNHSRSYGALTTNGARCGCDESCDAVRSESQPLLATQSTVSYIVCLFSHSFLKS